MRWHLPVTMAVVLASASCTSGAAPSVSPSSGVPTSTVSPATEVSPTTAVATTSVSSTSDVPLVPLTTVVLLGDSLLWEATPYLRPLLADRTVVERSFGGTAPCDGLYIDPVVDASTVVVVSFIGNSFTPCMTDANGEFFSGDALIEKYRADVDALVARLREQGATVLLVGQPIRADKPSDAALAEMNNVLYRTLAERQGVHFADAGAAVENPDGSFTMTLPCLPGEVECGVDGRNVVRTDDLLHFCPTGAEFTGCPVYSSGAHRFALAIAAAVDAL